MALTNGAGEIDGLPGTSAAKLTVAVARPGPEVLKFFPCSTQLSIKIFTLIHVKMPTIIGILTFMSRQNSILGLSEPKINLIS